MFAGIRSRLKRRPCHRGNRGYCCGQWFEAAPILHPGQIGQFPFGDESFGQDRIHAVHAEHDKTLDPALGISLAAAKKTKQPPNRPGQQGKDAGEDTGENDQDRTAYGKTRPGTYVRLGRRRTKENDENDNAAHAGPHCRWRRTLIAFFI